MWSLPDIQRLNRQRVEKLEYAVRTGVLDGKTLRCECGKNDKKCRGALEHQLWYDVFSDDPKGIITQCEYHHCRYGRPEGFFWCGCCHRLMIENYSWEIYVSEDGGQLCIKCAAQDYIENEDNWIPLRDEDIVVIGLETLRRARHVIGFGMPVPKQILRLDGLVLDSVSWGLVRELSYADPDPEAAVETLREILSQAKDAGFDRALLIADGMYELAFSIGVYIRSVPCSDGLEAS